MYASGAYRSAENASAVPDVIPAISAPTHEPPSITPQDSPTQPNSRFRRQLENQGPCSGGM